MSEEKEKEFFYGRSVDEQLERHFWRRVGFAIFFGIVLAMLLGLLYGCATVEPVKPPMPAAVPERLIASFNAPNTSGKLYESPCTDAKVLAHVPPELLAEMHAATGTYGGQEYGVCWLWNIDKSAAVVLWDDGGYFGVPKGLLKFEVGA